MQYEFRWNDWNVEHIGTHGVKPSEAEQVVRRPARGYPKYLGDQKYLAKAQTSDGRYLQVIYIFSPADVVFVIHARPMTAAEKSKLKRRRR